MAVEITSRKELQAWLEDKPREWAQVIALRAALRVLPLTCDPAAFRDRTVDPRLPLAVFRASAISSGARKIPPDDIAAADAANAAADADAAVWIALSGDCNRLQDGTAPAALLAQPLWIERPDWFQDIWGRAAQWLSSPEDGFAIWREWYVRRLEGLPHAFDRFDAAADEAFYRWIIKQDDDWWKRDTAAVNADIAAKVEELRRSAPSPTVDFFISYASEDEAIALEVAAVLDDLGKSYIVQYRDFGQRIFVNAMNEGMAGADKLICLYSTNYVRSGHCLAEWNYFYQRDPTSEDRLIVAFLLEPTDLKPLMKPIVYQELMGLSQVQRREAIRAWIAPEPRRPTRVWVGNVITSQLSPQIASNDNHQLVGLPNQTFDTIEAPFDFDDAFRQLRMVLRTLIEGPQNLPRMMRANLDGYAAEITEHGRDATWGGLDLLIDSLIDATATLDPREFEPGQKKALENLFALHLKCMTSLKNAGERLRDLADVPVADLDERRDDVDDVVKRAGEVFDALREDDRLSQEFAAFLDRMMVRAKDVFHSRESARGPLSSKKTTFLNVGGVLLAIYNLAGSTASLYALPADTIIKLQGAIEAFFRLIPL